MPRCSVLSLTGEPDVGPGLPGVPAGWSVGPPEMELRCSLGEPAVPPGVLLAFWTCERCGIFSGLYEYHCQREKLVMRRQGSATYVGCSRPMSPPSEPASDLPALERA